MLAGPPILKDDTMISGSVYFHPNDRPAIFSSPKDPLDRGAVFGFGGTPTTKAILIISADLHFVSHLKGFPHQRMVDIDDVVLQH
eukprot:12416582-Heterocapsa_arctica.AAC.1